MNDAEEEFIIDQSKDPEIKDKKQETRRVSTLRPLTERMPLRMHSFRPVPRTITSYSSSMAALQLHCTTRWDPSEMNSREREKERESKTAEQVSRGISPEVSVKTGMNHHPLPRANPFRPTFGGKRSIRKLLP